VVVKSKFPSLPQSAILSKIMADAVPLTDAGIEPAPGAAHDPYAVLRNRDFLLYLIGRLVASMGQQMFVMAVGWELYHRTRSAVPLGLVGLTQMVPMVLFTLPAGHVADNYNRKQVIVFTTLIVMLASAGLTVVSAWQAPLSWVYLCLFITGIARTFLWAASAAFLPQLVERKDFSRAVNWSASVFQISCILGPAIAGGLIHFTGRAASVYAANALATLACCILVGMVRWHHVVAVKEKMTLRALLTGFSFVFANKIILGIITLDMFAVLLGGATALLPIYAQDILDVGPIGLGLLQGALPMGAVLCTFILAHRPPLRRAGRSLLWAVTAFGLATILFGISRWFWFSFLMLFACGAVDNISVVVRHTLVQLLTPNEKRGRVSAVNNLFIGTSNELGGTESSFVAQLFGPAIGNTLVTGTVISVVSGGIGTIFVVAAVAWIWPQIRNYGRLDA
jgi:MFS family permease